LATFLLPSDPPLEPCQENVWSHSPGSGTNTAGPSTTRRVTAPAALGSRAYTTTLSLEAICRASSLETPRCLRGSTQTWAGPARCSWPPSRYRTIRNSPGCATWCAMARNCLPQRQTRRGPTTSSMAPSRPTTSTCWPSSTVYQNIPRLPNRGVPSNEPPGASPATSCRPKATRRARAGAGTPCSSRASSAWTCCRARALCPPSSRSSPSPWAMLVIRVWAITGGAPAKERVTDVDAAVDRGAGAWLTPS
jgi:hypothetical protein